MLLSLLTNHATFAQYTATYTESQRNIATDGVGYDILLTRPGFVDITGYKYTHRNKEILVALQFVSQSNDIVDFRSNTPDLSYLGLVNQPCIVAKLEYNGQVTVGEDVNVYSKTNPNVTELDGLNKFLELHDKLNRLLNVPYIDESAVATAADVISLSGIFRPENTAMTDVNINISGPDGSNIDTSDVMPADSPSQDANRSPFNFDLTLTGGYGKYIITIQPRNSSGSGHPYIVEYDHIPVPPVIDTALAEIKDDTIKITGLFKPQSHGVSDIETSITGPNGEVALDMGSENASDTELTNNSAGYTVWADLPFGPGEYTISMVIINPNGTSVPYETTVTKVTPPISQFIGEPQLIPEELKYRVVGLLNPEHRYTTKIEHAITVPNGSVYRHTSYVTADNEEYAAGSANFDSTVYLLWGYGTYSVDIVTVNPGGRSAPKTFTFDLVDVTPADAATFIGEPVVSTYGKTLSIDGTLRPEGDDTVYVEGWIFYENGEDQYFSVLAGGPLPDGPGPGPAPPDGPDNELIFSLKVTLTGEDGIADLYIRPYGNYGTMPTSKIDLVITPAVPAAPVFSETDSWIGEDMYEMYGTFKPNQTPNYKIETTVTTPSEEVIIFHEDFVATQRELDDNEVSFSTDRSVIWGPGNYTIEFAIVNEHGRVSYQDTGVIDDMLNPMTMSFVGAPTIVSNGNEVIVLSGDVDHKDGIWIDVNVFVIDSIGKLTEATKRVSLTPQQASAFDSAPYSITVPISNGDGNYTIYLTARGGGPAGTSVAEKHLATYTIN